jgi:hypothetical protein
MRLLHDAEFLLRNGERTQRQAIEDSYYETHEKREKLAMIKTQEVRLQARTNLNHCVSKVV